MAEKTLVILISGRGSNMEAILDARLPVRAAAVISNAPKARGLELARKRALEAGVRVHGCTVHFVTAALDNGPIVVQAAVPVLPGDTEERLAARVLAEE